MLGAAFNDAVFVMALFLLSETFRAHANAAAGILVGQGCQRPYVLIKVSVLVLTVVGVVLTGPALGAIGVALVQCVMSLAMMVALALKLAAQAGSLRAVFTGNDLQIVARFIPIRKLLDWFR
jgi:O-antigen/teichoic acid export membrane protein